MQGVWILLTPVPQKNASVVQAKVPCLVPCYFFVAFPSMNGIQFLPSMEISYFNV